MPSNKLISFLTHFILIPLLILIPISTIADHGGFTATLFVTDVVDDGTDSIEVESREANVSFTEPHNVDIIVAVSFDKKVRSTHLTTVDFDVYLFNEFDEIINPPNPADSDTDPLTPVRFFEFTTETINSKHQAFTIKVANDPNRVIPVEAATSIILRLKKDAVESVERADIEAAVTRRIKEIPSNEEATIVLNLVRKEPAAGIPKVVSITRYDSSGFLTPGITGPFTVKIVLTELPRAFTPEHIEVTNGRVTTVVKRTPFYRAEGNEVIIAEGKKVSTNTFAEYSLDSETIKAEGNYVSAETIPNPTGRDYRYHPYYVTITPDLHSNDDIVITVKEFEDTVKPPNRYISANISPGLLAHLRNGETTLERKTKLTVKISTGATITPIPGLPVALPHSNNASIPVNGFYILTKDNQNSGLTTPTPSSHYNVRENRRLPDLQTFLYNGGIIDLVGPTNVPAGSVVISEVLWGLDKQLEDASESQWIELYNTTGTRIPITENGWFLRFYEVSEPVPSPHTAGIIDRIGTLHRPRAPWSLFDKGQSGGTKAHPLISMERLIYTTKRAANGIIESSWTASKRASFNTELTMSGRGIATPGFVNFTPLPESVSPPTGDTTPSIAGRRDIVISEIMYAMGSARLPQWIELHNTRSRKVNLQGWEVTIENDPNDEQVIETSLSFTLGETFVGADQAILFVTERGRHSGTGNDLGDFREARVIHLKQLLDIDARRYRLLSDTAFKITLTSPSDSKPADTAGNLGATPAWELPMAEGEVRSSIIRNYLLKSDGTMADEWLLASEETFQYAQHDTYYGRSSDHGTPGYRAGNPLPVQLSSFRPVREQPTDAVVITWTTESELNNAGFNILRSQTKQGPFVKVNPVLILGNGTTAERHNYTWMDTTAKPGVVYYYRIEEVSLSGDRQPLMTVRLRGHVSPTGRLLHRWADVKTQD